MKLILLIPFIFIYLFSFSQSIQDTSLYRIETIDGNEYIGTIVSEDTEQVILKTDLLGEIIIRKVSIK